MIWELARYIYHSIRVGARLPVNPERKTMTHFISIHLPLNPTDEELRKAREHLALLRTSSALTHEAIDESATLVPLAPAPGPVTLVPPAPPAPGAAAPAPVVDVRDSTGLPWDVRIHSGSKATNKDGTWKKRKGVQESEVKKIEAQIRATLPPAPAPVTAAPPPPAAPVAPAPEQVFQHTVAPPAPAPVAPAPVAPASVGAPTFVSVLTKISGLINGGKLTQAESANACKQLGIVDGEGNGSLPLAAQRTDLIPSLDALIDATVAGR